MSLAVFREIKHALKNLNPDDVRQDAERPVRVGVVASSPEILARMEAFLAPAHMSPERRAEALRSIIRNGTDCDVVLYESALLAPKGAFALDLASPETC